MKIWQWLTNEPWGITTLSAACAVVFLVLSIVLYRQLFKRLYDIILSAVAIVVLSPLLLLLTLIGAVKMNGKPFFTQARPGKKEKIFKMIKFRTMNEKRDESGSLLPDDKRLTKYGKILRATSLDELPELFNIFAGQMSIVGPRPLLVQYLPLYNKTQRRRHKVRPGLTGLAQVNGRNAISWQQKFDMDVKYVNKISFFGDMKIVFQTVGKVFKRSGISHQGHATMEFFMGNPSYNVLILSAGRRVELVNCFKAARDRLAPESKVFAADISRFAPAVYFADGYEILPRINDDKYIDSLIAICKRLDIKLIVPTIDTELIPLAKNRNSIEMQTSAKILLSDLDSVEIACDKQKTAEFLMANGFDLPKTFDLEKIDKKKLTYPLFIKPVAGSSSVNTFKVASAKELEFFEKYVPEPLLQEFVCGDEFTVDVFSDFNAQVISCVPRLRIAVRGGEVLKGRTVRDEKIIAEVIKLVSALKLKGQNTVQCIKNGDKIYFIEINARFGGGAPMSIYSGADSCEFIYRLLKGETPQYDNNFKELLFSRYDQTLIVPQEGESIAK